MTPENTLWYCRYCGGGMGISSIESKKNKALDEEFNSS